MADNLQNLQRNVNQTWKETFEGVDKTSQEFHDLVQEFTDFVGDWKEFSDLTRERLVEYIESLDGVQDHWEDINRWVSRNSDTLDGYVGSLSDIRNLFQSITSEVGGLRRRTFDNVHVVRNLANLATENLATLRQEEGLTDSIVKSLSRKSTKIQEEYKARLQLLGVNKEETNLPLILAQERQKLDITNARIGRLERARREGASLTRLEIEQLKNLRDLQKLQESNIELLDEHNRKAAKGLDELIQKQTKYYRAQRRGLRSDSREEDAGENAMPFRRVNIASKLMGKLGFAEESQELLRRYNRWATDRVEARQRTDLAQASVEEAQQSVGRAEEEQKKALVRAGSSSRSSQKLIQQFRNQKELTDNSLEAEKSKLSALDEAYFSAKSEASRKKIEAQQDETAAKINRLSKLSKNLASDIKREEENQKRLNRELGSANIQLNLAKEAVKDTADELEAAKKNEKEVFGRSFIAEFKTMLQSINPEALLAKIGAMLALLVWRQLLKIDEEAVKTKRVIGQWADASALANTKFVTGTEVLKTMRELGEQFHINPVQVFSPEELARVSQAQKLTGMTSEAAGNLAVQSRIVGKNANTYRDSIAAGANQANRLNHSAVNLSAVQNDVLNTSRAITLSYGKNVEALAKAAGSAAALGMNLQQVENISKNLMNFESSIEAEMQAQLLTGMQLNLAKAREYALNNDLNGVAQEIGRQGMDAAKFSHMNYIQQDNMAKALGMSREEMSKMLIMQEINRGLTAEQVAAMTGMKRQDIEALSAQEKWQTMKQRFLESLVPLLEPVLQVTSDIFRLLNPLLGIISKIAGWISRIFNIIPENWVYLRGLVGILAIAIPAALLRGVSIVGLFRRGLTGIVKVSSTIAGAIGSWTKNLLSANKAGQATQAVFDKAANRWRDTRTGRFVQTPNPAAARGTSKLGSSVSSLGKNMGNILKGAAAAVLIAGAVFILAKAAQEFMKVSWGGILKAVAGLMVLVGAVALVGAVMASGVGTLAVLAGAAAMVVMAGAVALLGLALKQFEAINWETLGKLPVAMLSLAAAGALALVAGPALALGAPLLLAGSLALLAASLPFRLALRNLTVVEGSRLVAFAEGISLVAVAVKDLAESLQGLNIAKFTALTAVSTVGSVGSVIASRIARPKESATPKAEVLGESKENPRENIEAAVQNIVIKQAEIRASAQRISVEQKAADLSKIEKKLDNVITAIKSATPTDWNWLEFNRTQTVNA